MSDEQTRFPYKFGRVLIESERVITPTLPGVTLQLGGGQVEMLRNIVYYLGLRNTFVSEYFDIDYEAPDDDDWETITTLVADLEYKLMGSENVPWGFNERIVGQTIETDATVGTNILYSTTVPANEVWVIDYANALNVNTACSLVYIILYGSGVKVVVEQSTTLAAGQYLRGEPKSTLQEGDKLEFQFFGCTAGDDLHCRWWGYKMVV